MLLDRAPPVVARATTATAVQNRTCSRQAAALSCSATNASSERPRWWRHHHASRCKTARDALQRTGLPGPDHQSQPTALLTCLAAGQSAGPPKDHWGPAAGPCRWCPLGCARPAARPGGDRHSPLGPAEACAAALIGGLLSGKGTPPPASVAGWRRRPAQRSRSFVLQADPTAGSWAAFAPSAQQPSQRRCPPSCKLPVPPALDLGGCCRAILRGAVLLPTRAPRHDSSGRVVAVECALCCGSMRQEPARRGGRGRSPRCASCWTSRRSHPSAADSSPVGAHSHC